MHITKDSFIGKFIRGFRLRHLRSKASEHKRRLRNRRVLAMLRKNKAEQIAYVMKFPVMQMTAAEFDSTPLWRKDDEKNCDAGTLRRLNPPSCLPDEKIIAMVVTGDQIICDQWGAGTSVPERHRNCYRVELVS